MLNYSASPVNLFESEVDPSRDVCASRMETGKQKGMPEDVEEDIRAVANCYATLLATAKTLDLSTWVR